VRSKHMNRRRYHIGMLYIAYGYPATHGHSTMLTASLPQHCAPTSKFLTSISTLFDTCVPTPLAFVSTLLGVLSIVSWLFAQLPQIFKNYTLKSASGLSIFFLAEWLLGDATNLCGALLTRQATWQVVVAAYYVTVDLALVCQYIWYSHIRPWQFKLEDRGMGNRRRGNSGSRDVIIGVSPASGGSSPVKSPGLEGKATPDAKPQAAKSIPWRISSSLFSPREKSTSSSSSPTISRPGTSPGPLGPSPKTILLISMIFAILANASPLAINNNNAHSDPYTASDTTETIGRILSWTSTILYLGSRLPQLYKNFHRRSTAGLSPTLFIAAFFGNLFYSTSLLTNPLAWSSYPPYGLDGWVGPEGSERGTWFSLAAPFWLGAAGVLGLDGAVGAQFLMYGEEKKVAIVKDERGRGRWRRVSGWMRGWVPSPSPARAQPRDDQRPLLSRTLGSDGYGAA